MGIFEVTIGVGRPDGGDLAEAAAMVFGLAVDPRGERLLRPPAPYLMFLVP